MERHTLHHLWLGAEDVEGVDIFGDKGADEQAVRGDVWTGRVGGVGTLGLGGLDPNLGVLLGLCCG